MTQQCPYRIKVAGKEMWLHCKKQVHPETEPHQPWTGLQTRGDRQGHEPTEGKWFVPEKKL